MTEGRGILEQIGVEKPEERKPIERIVLTQYNEALVTLDGHFPIYQDTLLNDATSMVCPVVHEACRNADLRTNPLEIIKISETHSVLYCRHCGLRIVFPNTITTFGQLLDWSNMVLSKKPAQSS